MSEKQWDGFLPPHNCKGCGNPLQGQYSGRPAELYAGTYTGLCYSCQNKPQRLEREYDDGAKLYSYAPHCPSWRRDREYFTTYEGCDTCKGQGRLYVSRSFPDGGPYYKSCPDCLKRFSVHPLRALYYKLSRRAYQTYDDVWKRLLKRKAYKDKSKQETLRADLLRRHERTKQGVGRFYDSLVERAIF